ncbi:ATP-binding protein [Streptomyces enissocaesilis]|uniref:DUF7848 domain-containing protein n=1 Tax=Streptomyces enissocaesilis TaxID=332589 RepID=A0ABP6JZL0_9ACTN
MDLVGVREEYGALAPYRSRSTQIETRYLRLLGGLRIEVHDGTCELPGLSTPGGDRGSGRGLWLVDALANRWGVGERPGLGKVVWAEISAPAGDGERRGQGGGETVSGDGHARIGTVLRFVDWTLSLDVSGSEPIHEVECATCHEAPKPGGRSALEEWCLRHAGRSRHTGFRAVTTSFFRATCHEALPEAPEAADGGA